MSGQLVHAANHLASGKRYVLSGFTYFDAKYLDMKRRDTLATMAYLHGAAPCQACLAQPARACDCRPPRLVWWLVRCEKRLCIKTHPCTKALVPRFAWRATASSGQLV